MADDLNDAFVPIRDKDGNVTGIMDRAMAEHLASTAPDPTQASLDVLLTGVTRVRVVPFANKVAGATEQRVLLDTPDPTAVASFRGCFAIVEDPESFGHCMCLGDPHLELYSGDRHVATLGYHHGLSIRWDAWKYDAWLKEPDRLLDWMSAHGVPGPRQEVEAMKRRGEESRRNAERWRAAMPACFLPFLDRMQHEHDPELHRLLLEALRAAHPDPQAQALELFRWFGSGAGRWSGYPAYEGLPEQLLLHYPTQLLLDALTGATPTETQWLGASRYFAGWDFRKSRRKDVKLIPNTMKPQLLEAARRTAIPDNVERATRAYGE